MNKLCVLSANVKTYFMRRLIKEVGDGAVVYNPWIDTQNPECETFLVRTSGIHRDDKDIIFLESLHNNIKIFNPLPSLKTFRSKESQYQFFGTHLVPHLSWLDVGQDLNKSALAALLDLSGKYLVKPKRGQGGWGIKVLEADEFQAWFDQQQSIQDLDYIIQPFVENAREFRLFFCDDYRLCLERKNISGTAANFSAGGEATLVNLPTELSTPLERLIALSGAHYGAIDLLVTKDQLYILELNVTPGIEQAEQLSGDNILRIILNGILQ